MEAKIRPKIGYKRDGKRGEDHHLVSQVKVPNHQKILIL